MQCIQSLNWVPLNCGEKMELKLCFYSVDGCLRLQFSLGAADTMPSMGHASARTSGWTRTFRTPAHAATPARVLLRHAPPPAAVALA
jgi:hypothetical protein